MAYYEKRQYKKKEEEHFTKGNGEVYLDDCNGDLEKAIRKLRKKLKGDGLFDELKRRESYEKPSEKKRRKKAVSRFNESKNNKDL